MWWEPGSWWNPRRADVGCARDPSIEAGGWVGVIWDSGKSGFWVPWQLICHTGIRLWDASKLWWNPKKSWKPVPLPVHARCSFIHLREVERHISKESNIVRFRVDPGWFEHGSAILSLSWINVGQHPYFTPRKSFQKKDVLNSEGLWNRRWPQHFESPMFSRPNPLSFSKEEVPQLPGTWKQLERSRCGQPTSISSRCFVSLGGFLGGLWTKGFLVAWRFVCSL